MAVLSGVCEKSLHGAARPRAARQAQGDPGCRVSSGEAVRQRVFSYLFDSFLRFMEQP
ncbi:hypothetical protein [Simplicispira piscis]